MVYGGIISGAAAGIIIGLLRLFYFGVNTSSMAALIIALLTAYTTAIGITGSEHNSLHANHL